MHAWSNGVLDGLRERRDPVADALVAAEPRGELHRFLADQGPPSGAVAGFLREHAALPAGVDLLRVRRGQRVYGTHAIQAMIALLCKGLPESYAAPKGAAILLVAGRFAREPRARLMETARFFHAVMAPGGLDGPDAPGVREALKVRLVHAVARSYIAAHPDYHPELGAPVNQEDQLGTLMAFSILVLDAMPMLGVHLSPRDEADYLHAWGAVGSWLGVDPAWIPDSPADARALFAWIRERHFRESPAGRILTAALLEALAEMLPGLEGIPPSLVRYLCGDEVAGFIGVAADRSRLAVPALRLLGKVTEDVVEREALAGPAERLGRAVFDAVYAWGSQGRRPRYVAPG